MSKRGRPTNNNVSVHLSLSPLVRRWLASTPSASAMAEKILAPHAQQWAADTVGLMQIQKIREDLAKRGNAAIRIEENCSGPDRILWLYRDGRERGPIAAIKDGYISLAVEGSILSLPPRWSESDEWGALEEQIEGLVEDIYHEKEMTMIDKLFTIGDLQKIWPADIGEWGLLGRISVVENPSTMCRFAADRGGKYKLEVLYPDGQWDVALTDIPEKDLP